jgi:hypothetical protein
MIWQDETVALLRALIWDIDEAAYRYTDDQLETVVVAAARYVAGELDFPTDFSCDPVNVRITPDPSADATRDESFVNLAVLKAACLLDRGAASLAAGNAYSARDGGTALDLRDVFKARMALAEKGWCKAYKEAADDYAAGQSGVVVGAGVR